MAHVARINENNIVEEVIVVSNDIEPNVVEFATNLLGGTWVQTSYNATFCKHFAGIGYSYNADIDAFVPPKCHEEATLDNETANWICGNEEHNVPVS
jgi:hypothetical protein